MRAAATRLVIARDMAAMAPSEHMEKSPQSPPPRARAGVDDRDGTSRNSDADAAESTLPMLLLRGCCCGRAVCSAIARTLSRKCTCAAARGDGGTRWEPDPGPDAAAIMVVSADVRGPLPWYLGTCTGRKSSRVSSGVRCRKWVVSG